jgi:cell division protein FtsL
MEGRRMIRPTTVLWMGLAGAVGFGLFQLKHEVQALEDEMFRLNRNIVAEQQAIHVLKAEWSYINQPQRLQALAARHLDLLPMKPAQLGGLADLPVRGAEDTTIAKAPAKPPQSADKKIVPVKTSAPGATRTIEVVPVSTNRAPQERR